MQSRYMMCTWIASQRLKEKELISHGFNFKLLVIVLLAVPTTFQIFRVPFKMCAHLYYVHFVCVFGVQ